MSIIESYVDHTYVARSAICQAEVVRTAAAVQLVLL